MINMVNDQLWLMFDNGYNGYMTVATMVNCGKWRTVARTVNGLLTTASDQPGKMVDYGYDASLWRLMINYGYKRLSMDIF